MFDSCISSLDENVCLVYKNDVFSRIEPRTALHQPKIIDRISVNLCVPSGDSACNAVRTARHFAHLSHAGCGNLSEGIKVTRSGVGRGIISAAEQRPPR